MTALDQLLALAGPPLGGASAPDVLATSLAPLLAARDGFYAFISALHVLPAHELAAWNAPATWRGAYGELIPADCVCFAEDAFGNPFVVRANAIHMLDAETGLLDDGHPSLEAWIAALLAEHRVMTGWPLAQAWQELHGPLPPGHRLVPKRPFVLGGEYAVSNLYAAETIGSLRVRGEIARQLADVPDGAQIVLRLDKRR